MVGASVYAYFFTWGMLWLIDKFVTVKVSDEEEEAGLDVAVHGEIARM